MAPAELKAGQPGTQGLVLYSRAGCHLCEDAERMLASLSVPFTRIEVSSDDDLERRYGWDVPVLTRSPSAGHPPEVLLKGVFSRARILARLAGRP